MSHWIDTSTGMCYAAMPRWIRLTFDVFIIPNNWQHLVQHRHLCSWSALRVQVDRWEWCGGRDDLWSSSWPSLGQSNDNVAPGLWYADQSCHGHTARSQLSLCRKPRTSQASVFCNVFRSTGGYKFSQSQEHQNCGQLDWCSRCTRHHSLGSPPGWHRQLDLLPSKQDGCSPTGSK